MFLFVCAILSVVITFFQVISFSHRLDLLMSLGASWKTPAVIISALLLMNFAVLFTLLSRSIS